MPLSYLLVVGTNYAAVNPRRSKIFSIISSIGFWFHPELIAYSHIVGKKMKIENSLLYTKILIQNCDLNPVYL